MASWKGHRIDEVIAKWGPPDNVYDAGDIKNYVWQQVTGKSPVNGRVWAREYRIFKVDAKGIIVDSEFGEKRE